MKIFTGAGGSSATATNTPDNLSSTDQVEMVIGLCQGPIKGLTNGNQSFFVGTTQLQNADGTDNFDLFNLTIYPGNTPADPIIPVLGGFQDFRPIQTDSSPSQLQPNETQSFTTVTPNLSCIIVLINVAKLYQSGDDVQLRSLPGVGSNYSTFLPSSFQVGIAFTDANGVRTDPFNGPVTLNGKTQTGTSFELRFTPTGPGPWFVEVDNLTTPNNTSSFLTAYLGGYFEVQAGTFGFARSDTVNTALVTQETITRTTMPPNTKPDGSIGIDMIAVRIDVNELLRSDDDGTHNGAVQLTILYKQTSSTDWINPFGGPVTITGKTTTIYTQDYRWNVAPVDDTYDVSVEISSDDVVNQYQSLAWESMQEIVGGPMTYDGLACAYILAQASGQFSSVPALSGEYDLLLCHIPSNYDPYGRTYTGAWDGTFKLDWTSNPAFCLYELAMNATWGAVTYWPHLNINKYDIYAAAQWCDTLVPNGQGGTQPRYTYNGVIANPRGIRDQLRYMAGTFNGTFLDDLNGNTRVVFDSNEDAVAIFTQENVTEGTFSYSYTDPSTRYNYITGSYDEPNLNYTTVPLVVQNQAHITRYGMITTNIDLVGCTNAHEALQRLTYKLIAATTETEIISFSTNRLGLMLRPFNVILVSDPDMGNGLSGRIRDIDATRTLIYLRDLLVLEVGVVYMFQTYLSDPGYPTTSLEPLMLVEIPFTAFVSGGSYALELSSPLPDAVASDATFTIGAQGTLTGVPKAYRITSIEIANGDPDSIGIQAIEVNRNKFALADNASTQITYSSTNLSVDIAPPTSLTVTTQVVNVNGQAIANVVAFWVPSADARVVSYTVQYRLAGDTNWTLGATTTSSQADIYNVPDGTYDFAVQAVSLTGALSLMVYSYSTPAGLNVPPSDVSLLTVTQLGTNLNLVWTPIPDGDLSYYWLRYSPAVDGTAVWGTATDLIQQVSATSAQVPLLAGTYFVKAVDTSGIASVNAASAVASTIVTGMIVVENVEQYPTWPGTKTNTTIDGSGVLVVNIGSGNPVGSYSWNSEDFGSVFTSTISLALVASASNLGVHMSDWPTLSSVTTLADVKPTDYTVQVFIALSTDGTTFGPTQPFSTGSWTGRKFQFTVQMTSNTANIAPELSSCSAIISMTDRIVREVTVPVTAAGLEVLFSPVFHVTPTVVISILNAASGDYFVLTDVSNGGFFVTCYDNTNTAVNRNISYLVVGYGVS